MSGDKSAVSTQKQRRLFTQLLPSLVQLVNDRFDEDQHEQAVELLEQLRVEGVRPSKSLIQKLVALSLCSLAPGQVASTSRWTIDHQLQDIAARLLTQPKATQSDRSVMKAASTASDRPSQTAVLKASSLLLQYSEASIPYGISHDDAEARKETERRTSLLARHILESLPSQRKPLDRAESPESARRARRDSFKSEDGDHDGSFEDSSIERWVRNDLQHAEDIWDLLCGGRFSNSDEVQGGSLRLVSEFWMNHSERRRYQKQLQTSSSGQRLEDRLKDIRRKKLNGGPSGNLSNSDSDDTSDDDDLLVGLSVPGRANTRPATKERDIKASSTPKKPAKRARTGKIPATTADDEGKQQQRIKMTEGAWRTLSILLELWRRASSGPKASPVTDEELPLLWQFPRSHQARHHSRTTSKAAANKDAIDEIDRALDVVFSFPSILPAYTPSSTGTEVASDLFDTAKAADTRGHARPLSTVPQPELAHRQATADQKAERFMAERAKTAAQLLACIYELVQLRHVSHVAFTEGVSERIEALRNHEVQYLLLPLLSQQPYVVANVLTAQLKEATRTRPDKKRSSELMRFGSKEEVISLDGSLAYAMPLEETATTLLKNISNRAEDRDSKAILDFLSRNRLELDSSANSTSPTTFPTRSESRKSSIVRKQKQKPIKSESNLRKKAAQNAEASATVTEEMKQGGLEAFAFVRAAQIEARDRINQMKFLIARALFTLLASREGSSSKQGIDQPANGSSSAKLDDEKIVQSEWADQQRSLGLFLTRLTKAFQHDADEFRECVSAMQTHVSKDSAGNRHNNPSSKLEPNTGKDGEDALPSLDASAARCQKTIEATQNLADATQILLNSLPKAS